MFPVSRRESVCLLWLFLCAGHMCDFERLSQKRVVSLTTPGQQLQCDPHLRRAERPYNQYTTPPPVPLASCFASSLFTHLRQHVFSLYIEIENISLCVCYSISVEVARVVCRRSHCFRRPFDRGQCGIIEKFLMAYALQ